MRINRRMIEIKILYLKQYLNLEIENNNLIINKDLIIKFDTMKELHSFIYNLIKLYKNNIIK